VNEEMAAAAAAAGVVVNEFVNGERADNDWVDRVTSAGDVELVGPRRTWTVMTACLLPATNPPH